MDLDEVAHNEPPHQDLRCSQIQLFSSHVPKVLNLFVSDAYKAYADPYNPSGNFSPS